MPLHTGSAPRLAARCACWMVRTSTGPWSHRGVPLSHPFPLHPGPDGRGWRIEDALAQPSVADIAEVVRQYPSDSPTPAGRHRSTTWWCCPPARGERGGKKLDLNALHLFHVRDGKVTEVWTVYHDLYAWDDFWS